MWRSEADDKHGHFVSQSFLYLSAIVANLLTSSSLFVFGMEELARTSQVVSVMEE